MSQLLWGLKEIPQVLRAYVKVCIHEIIYIDDVCLNRGIFFNYRIARNRNINFFTRIKILKKFKNKIWKMWMFHSRLVTVLSSDNLTKNILKVTKPLALKNLKTIQQKELKLMRTTAKSTYNRSSFSNYIAWFYASVSITKEYWESLRAVFDYVKCNRENKKKFPKVSLEKAFECDLKKRVKRAHGGFNYYV